jgi:hypothetical protein
MWITSKLDQIVGFSGNIFDTRKRDMLPSPAGG